MVVSCAPVRVSFGGGGTDLEAYYARFGGFVVSAAIDHYCYVMATAPADGSITIHSASDATSATSTTSAVASNVASRNDRTTETNTLWRLTDAAITLLAPKQLRRRGVRLTFATDVPPGTGLGVSSATAVALLHTLTRYLGRPTSAETLARQACELEIDQLGMPIGRQDQYASAFGGLNSINFTSDGVDLTPLALAEPIRQALAARLLLFSTGRRHNSSTILRQQRADTRRQQSTIARLHRMKSIGYAMRAALLAEDLDGFGILLDLAWHEKRRLSAAISNTSIDSWYFAARTAGALGGKITGAGGGGYLLLYVPPEKTRAVRAVMAEAGLCELRFGFAPEGVRSLARLPDVRVARLRNTTRHSNTGDDATSQVRIATPPATPLWTPIEKGLSHA